MPKCKSCGAEIIYLKTKSGKLMPCNAELVPYWMDRDGQDKIVTPYGEVVSCTMEQLTFAEPTGTGYMPHWATCPDADKFRNRAERIYDKGIKTNA